MARLPSFLSGSGNARDLGVAGFAAAAIAFAAFAMPDWRLTQIVEMTGLAAVFPPAQPPLGMTARFALALAAGLASFTLFAWLLRALDRVPAAPSGVDADRAPEPIRLRRADAHPDAPARRPLVAGRDLGEPVEEELVLDVALERDSEPEPEAESELAAAPEPEAEPELAAAPEPAASVEEPVLEVLPEQPAPAPEVLTVEEVPAAPPRDESISELMQRLESGISRRERVIPAAETAAPSPTGDAVGHRLRSAINDLQKLAARA
jgi:hypothetical protein